MIIQTTEQMNFSDYAIAKRKIDMSFFDNINKIVDWNKLEVIIKKFYDKGQSVDGRSAYSGLLLFKITLLQQWFKLSDVAVEERINDSIKFNKFLELSLEDSVPDHSVISRFRTVMAEKNATKKVLGELNRQLSKHKIMVKTGVIIDASITVTDFTPDTPTTFELPEDRAEDIEGVSKEEHNYYQTVQLKASEGVDTEARWLKKGNKSYYGYKKHVATNDDGLVLAVQTTPANESDTGQLKTLLKELRIKKGTRVKADKGYTSASNKEFLKSLGLKNGIQYKAVRGKALTTREKSFNKAISKTRYVIERTFGSIVKWFDGAKARYKGLQKTDYQHHTQAIAYNIYRAPGLVWAKA